jgi:luciferase family oxidoreductase group 1
MPKLQIGLLNFASSYSRDDHLTQVQQLVDYTVLADQLGFSRFWLAEHLLYRASHTWTSPDMLLPVLAAATRDIRIGVAGTLISTHSPLDVATNYKMLANLFPGRIDLGLAKGGSTGQAGKASATTAGTADTFTENARTLVYYLRCEELVYNNGLIIPPYQGEIPEIWLLGSSYRNTALALELGANFSRSVFHLNSDPDPDTEGLNIFKAAFQQKFDTPPGISVATAICCHDDPRQANEIAAEYLRKTNITLDHTRVLAGPVHQLSEQIHTLHKKYAVSEFILLQLYLDHEDRLRGIESLAKAFELQPRVFADRAI